MKVMTKFENKLLINIMTQRERFLNTLNGKPTDRPPLYVSIVPQLAKRLSDHLGVPYEEPISSLLGSRISFNNMLVGMGVDAIGVAACFPDNNQPITREDGITINEWGIGTKSTVVIEFCSTNRGRP